MYTILLKDGNDTELYRKEQMLLGQSFQMNDTFSIPLPKNAEEGTLKVEVILENSRNGEAVQSFDLTSLQVPTFNRLYLLLGNKSVVELLSLIHIFKSLTSLASKSAGLLQRIKDLGGDTNVRCV